MLDLFLLKESFTCGYINCDVLHIISLISIFCGVSLIIVKNPIVSVLFLTGLYLSIATYLMVLGLNFLDFPYFLLYVAAVSILFLYIFMSFNLRVSELTIDSTNVIFLAIIIGIMYLGLSFDLLDHKWSTFTSTLSIVSAIRYIISRNTTDLQACIALLLITVFYAIVYDIWLRGLCDELDYFTELFILLLFIVILSYTVMWKLNSNKYNWIFTLFINIIMLLLIFFAVYINLKYGADIAYAEEPAYTQRQISAFCSQFHQAMMECVNTGANPCRLDWVRMISFDHVMSKTSHFYSSSPRLLNDVLVYKIGAPHTFHTAVYVCPDGRVVPSPILLAIRDMAVFNN